MSYGQLEYRQAQKNLDPAFLPAAQMTERGITKETCEKFGVKCSFDTKTGQPECYHFPLYDMSGKLVGWQHRKPKGQTHDGTWSDKGTERAVPFGSHTLPKNGKLLIVVEGTEDVLAARQMLDMEGKTWRVVSAMGTDRWKGFLEYFKGFEKVAIAFDNDEPGKKAAAELANALGDKSHIVSLTEAKDPCEMLELGMSEEFVAAINQAKKYEPVGFMSFEDIVSAIENYTEPTTYPYPPEWSVMSSALVKGMRAGEISIWTGSTGQGKTTVMRRIKQHLVQAGYTIGEIELEESKEKTIRGMLEFHLRKPLSETTVEERLNAAQETYGTGRIILLDHNAALLRGGQGLEGCIEYMAYAKQCQVIFLDHITLAVNHFGDGGGGLQQQDAMMARLMEIAGKTNVHLALISHIRKGSTEQGIPYSRGGEIDLEALKGSGSLGQIASDVFSLERNGHAKDITLKNLTLVRVLKCRETGYRGPADALLYDRDSRTLTHYPASTYEALKQAEDEIEKEAKKEARKK